MNSIKDDFMLTSLLRVGSSEEAELSIIINK
jgi:hypothetical protein